MAQKKKNNKILIIVTFIWTFIYLLWRTFFTIPLGEGIFALIWAILLLVCEITGMLESIIHFKNMSNIEYPKRPIISEDQYVDVDVFIATYNEPVDLLYKTVNGCLNMDYPDKNKVHIHICDDSNRPEMKELADRLGVNYITRTEKKDAKAGNYNNALRQTSAPLVVTFDADMIPSHDFLYACIPYFYLYEKVGFVQLPQSFYNPDLFQYNLFSEKRIPNEQDYFYRDIQVSRNKTNSVIYGGSNTVISRKALEEIGGFYTKVITEDFATGMLIQSNGYRCIAIDEIHAMGLSPGDLKSLIKQRDRWARGCIQSGKKLNILFRKGLNLEQKLSYLSSITYWYGSIKRFVYIMSPILFAVFNVVVVKCTLPQVLIFWLPMYILTNLFLKQLSNGIRTSKWTNIYETVLFPSLLPGVLMETFGISQTKFSVTKKDGIEDDRDYRIKCAIPHVILAILSLIGMWNCVKIAIVTKSIYPIVSLFWLILNFHTIVISILFMFGRKVNRETERFKAEVDCNIQFENENIECTTYDISEKGLSVILKYPIYIDYEKDVKIRLATDRLKCAFLAEVVHVSKVRGGYKYAFYVNHITEKNFRKFLNIIYDREPSYPKTVEEDSNVLEDIDSNIRKRAKGDREFTRKLPRIKLGKSFKTSKLGEIKIVNFNYEHMVLEVNPNRVKENKLRIGISENIKLNLRLVKELEDYGNNSNYICNLYEVENYKDFVYDEEFKEILKQWIKDYKATQYLS